MLQICVLCIHETLEQLINPTCLFILKKSYLLYDQRIKEHKTNSLVQSGQSAHKETSTQPRGQRAMDQDNIQTLI